MKGIKSGILGIALLSTGLHAGANIECFIIRAPEKMLVGVKKIAILDFDGDVDKRRVIADYMISDLLKENRGIYAIGGNFFVSAKEGKTYQKGARTNVFEIVERSQLERILKEQNIGTSGIVDEQQAAKIGKILGLDAILTGSISYSSVDEQSESQWKDDNGRVHTKYCTERKVTAKGRVKIISVNTAQILGTADASANNSQTKCDEERSGLQPASELADACLKDISSTFVNYFAPGFTQVKYEFSEIKNKEFKEKSKAAIDFIKKADLGSAFSIYKAMYDVDQYNADIAGSLGNLYDIVGNYAKAKEYWDIAAELDQKKYSKSIEWVNKEIQTAEMLSSLGVIIEPGEFSSNANALLEQITTKGQKSDRLEVYEEPKSGSAVTAKVPGDTKFTVLKNDGDWYQIKLLGEKQGYIQKSNVR